MTTEQEYVVYNTITDNVVSPPMPRENAESICAEFWDAGSRRYAIRPVVGFDYDAAIEATRLDEARSFEKFTLWPLASENEYERQWVVDLHALANGPVLVALIGVWFVGLMVVAIVLG